MKPATALALVALTSSLGGCKSFVQAFDFSRQSSAPQYALGEADLEEGKAHLRAGRVGNALSPLHRATLNPATRGEALNALGVVYAKLDRADLAERYFIAATRIDAGNDRFAANLDRFYRSNLARDTRLLHVQRERAQESFAAYASTAHQKPLEEEPDTRLVQSGGETRSITISGPATSTRVSTGVQFSANAAKSAQPAAYPARVRISGGVIQPNRGTIRPAQITISSAGNVPAGAPRVRVGSAASAPGYPVRVRIPTRPATSSGE